MHWSNINDKKWEVHFIKLSASDRGVTYYTDLKYGTVIMHFNNNMQQHYQKGISL